MQTRALSRAMTILALTLVAFSSINAQAKAGKPAKADKADKARDSVLAKFFTTSTPITATLTTNIKRIRGDKGENAPWRPATVSYTDSAGKEIVIPARIKTRGIWRLKNCDYPPIRLNFKGEDTKHTVFHGLDQPKLVNYCRNDDTYEQYILQEFQLYRIYQLLTPVSHAARLLKLTYADSADPAKPLATRYAFIEEEPSTLAARNNGKIMKIKGATPDNLEPFHDALVGFFSYMIGNTDWSISGLHNAEIVGQNSGDFIPVVYDFDFAGAVNARYATVDPKLAIRRVRDRMYRGYCVPPEEYPKVVELFNAKKDSIYALYHDDIGKLLKPNIVDETLKYYDEFYKTINDPRQLKREIIETCIGDARK
jgi:hypothetical protein